jgi:hypothetical protein
MHVSKEPGVTQTADLTIFCYNCRVFCSPSMEPQKFSPRNRLVRRCGVKPWIKKLLIVPLFVMDMLTEGSEKKVS